MLIKESVICPEIGHPSKKTQEDKIRLDSLSNDKYMKSLYIITALLSLDQNKGVQNVSLLLGRYFFTLFSVLLTRPCTQFTSTSIHAAGTPKNQHKSNFLSISKIIYFHFSLLTVGAHCSQADLVQYM